MAKNDYNGIVSGSDYIPELTGGKSSLVDSLIGLIPSSVTDAEVRKERLKRYENGVSPTFTKEET